MVYFRSFLGAAAILSSLATARPMPDHPEGSSYEAPAYGDESWSASSAAAHATSSAVKYESTAAWTSSAAVAHTTSSALAHESTSVSYGSGSSNWGGAQYNDCVNKCVAEYGSPAQSWAPTGTSGGEAGSQGTGATHTVIVAPTQGVLRFVPFAVNASIGDTVKFMWGANNHTVTKGSALLPCNKTGDALFTSGVQNKDFVFTQVVNTTDPTYFFCNTPGHCQKGMFGMINPPSAWGSPTSLAAQVGNMTSSNSDVAAMVAYTNDKTKGNAQAAGWGKNIDLAGLPEWAHEAVVENTMYVRTLIAANPEILSKDGSLDLGAVGSNPLMIPQDLSVALSANVASSSVVAATAAASTTGAAPTDAAPANAASQNQNGAISTGSSKILVAATALVATFFLL